METIRILNESKKIDEVLPLVYRGSNYNGDGRIYPDTAVVVLHNTDFLPFGVWDVTGWNGYEQCGDHCVASFQNEADSIQYVKLHYEKWSDPVAVLEASASLLNKDQGAFSKLKRAVDWRDK